jgi:broad specificity phosphatase PhoE
MRITTSLIAILLAATQLSASVVDEIAATPEKSGGIYYAYPVSADALPTAPKGYSPVFISHYGRHGSRWAIQEWKYYAVRETFREALDEGNLTPEGVRVAAMVDTLWADAEGNAGALTPLGEQQHRAIAERLYNRFPALFAGNTTVRAYSSTEPRCIVSMAAFCERLKELNPELTIRRSAAPGNMHFIAYHSPEVKAASADTAAWHQHYREWSDTIVRSQRLMSSLFVDPTTIDNPNQFAVLLHDIAIAEQNTTCHTGIMNIFTADEQLRLWKLLDYDMYVQHAAAPATRNAGPHAASTLLQNFIDDADRRLAAAAPGVTLRFGHDTHLIRLLAFIGVEGCANAETDPDKYHLAWQDYRVSPMGANLQIIFYRNAKGKTLALLRHNEQPVRITGNPLNTPLTTADATGTASSLNPGTASSLNPVTPPKPVKGTDYFYDWAELRAYFEAILATVPPDSDFVSAPGANRPTVNRLPGNPGKHRPGTPTPATDPFLLH